MGKDSTQCGRERGVKVQPHAYPACRSCAYKRAYKEGQAKINVTPGELKAFMRAIVETK